MAKQVISRQRVTDHGEVFTAEREVKAMLDLVKQETDRVDSRFLEPACGDGNFLAEILRRKLEAAKKRAIPPKNKKPQPLEFEKQSILAVASIYGVDLLKDNVQACRSRLYDIWDKEYNSVCKREVNEDCREAVKFILSRNIVCGNALSLKVVDENGQNTDEPIVFSEWTFVMGNNMQRKDYRFDKLLQGNSEAKELFGGFNQSKKKNEKSVQIKIFDLEMGGNSESGDEGELLKQYISYYRRVQDND